jgi:hypothetical protein
MRCNGKGELMDEELAQVLEAMKRLGLLADSDRKRPDRAGELRTVWVATPLMDEIRERFEAGEMSVERARHWRLID